MKTTQLKAVEATPAAPQLSRAQLHAMLAQIAVLAHQGGEFGMDMLEREGSTPLANDIHMIRTLLGQIGAIADVGSGERFLGGYNRWFMGRSFMELEGCDK